MSNKLYPLRKQLHVPKARKTRNDPSALLRQLKFTERANLSQQHNVAQAFESPTRSQQRPIVNKFPITPRLYIHSLLSRTGSGLRGI